MATNTPNYNLSVPENTDTMEDTVQAYRNNLNIIDANLGGGGGGNADVVHLTQEEYDALPASKTSDHKIYMIEDTFSEGELGRINVNGMFIDTDNVIASGSYSSTFSYTATEDCYIRVAIAGSANSSSTAYINGKQVFGVWNGSNGIYTESPLFPLKKGQVLTVNASNSATSSYIVYGVQPASNVVIIPDYLSSCYSTSEREIGCWVDGKPLYQRTISFTVGSSGTYNTYDTGIQNPENILINFDASFYVFSASFIVGIEPYVYSGSAPATSELMIAAAINSNKIRLDYRNGADVVGKTAYVTLQYTKTTDTAGGGEWTPHGTPTVHYSTEETCIGTWIDGKPLYQKTIQFVLTATSRSGEMWYYGSVDYTGLLPNNIEHGWFVNGYYDAGSGVHRNIMAGEVEPSDTTLLLFVNYSRSSVNAVATIQYTKTS